MITPLIDLAAEFPDLDPHWIRTNADNADTALAKIPPRYADALADDPDVLAWATALCRTAADTARAYNKASEWTEEVTYRVINHRYEHQLPTIVTSNLGGGDLRTGLGERIASRLAEMAKRVALKGTDRRRVTRPPQANQEPTVRPPSATHETIGGRP
jgi:DNA replication protein DnaC